MASIEKLKYYLIKTSLGKYLRKTQHLLVFLQLSIYGSSRYDKSKRTVYCISPYKTGTTYLSSLFSSKISAHEPVHYTSWKLLNKNFSKYFIKRMNYLNIKLECSGHWSAFVDDLANDEVAKDLDYICILRSPSSWISSVINYWHIPPLVNFKFDFANEFYWKDTVGVDLKSFNFETDTEENKIIIDKLIEFYFDFTNKTRLLNNVTYINLKEINEKLPIVESLINEKANMANSFKRSNKSKKFEYKNEKIDQEYEQLTKTLLNTVD
ncbi:hypothetical protein [Winogradskyella flava]|uniref:hypothetical protein n=1 Tax=Winogradskyella flava TaxID=1884876 RepID=UPI002492CD41|nr:hypothetical protein [Winogradskyella flava]